MKKFKTNSSNVREIFAIRNVSENFEWRIRQRSRGLTRVSGASRRRRTAFNAFTMAEILLSLTIIGVVAAITLPSLTGNINERTWNTQRKTLYARFSQALALMPILNGYGTLTSTTTTSTDAEGNTTQTTSIIDTAAETFITDGLAKVMKINNICNFEHLEDCGVASKITVTHGSVITNFTTSYNTLATYNSAFDSTKGIKQNTRAAAFETANGESILVYYNPKCVGDFKRTTWHYAQQYMCANFVYDLNGSKGPNTFGKDIGFITALYPLEPQIVAPMPFPTREKSAVAQNKANNLCKAKDREARLPNRYELTAMFYNRTLLNIPTQQQTGGYWSSTIGTANGKVLGWRIHFEGILGLGNVSDSHGVWCIKR